MIYYRISPYFAGVKDGYKIISYNVDRMNSFITIKLAYLFHDKDGNIQVEPQDYTLNDVKEYIIDPDWNESSSPPKPERFNYLDPTTWGNLSWDQIPKVLNKNKLYATNILIQINEGKNVENAIIKTLVELGRLPQGTEWVLA